MLNPPNFITKATYIWNNIENIENILNNHIQSYPYPVINP